MRRLAMVLASGVLVVGVVGPAAAQEAPTGPPWWQGERAEMSEEGFALTVPDGWVALDLTAGLQQQVGTLATAVGMPKKEADDYVGVLRRVRDRGALLVLTTDDANCEVRVEPSLGPGYSEALANYRYQDASDDEDILAVDPPRAVELPVGTAYQMSWTTAGGNPELSMFLGQNEDLAFEIKCSGQSRPEDDWLGVATGFTWLADAATTDAATTDAGTDSASSGTGAEVPTTVPAGPPYPDRVEGTGVYDQADVFGPFAVGVANQVIRDVEEASGAQVVVYTQVKPESDTFEEAAADALALLEQWELGPDALVVLFDLIDPDPDLCYSQVQLYASEGYAARHLSNAQRQALFDEAIMPPLAECDFDTALLGTMSRIAAAAGVGPNAEGAAAEA